jgi:anti-sigma factor RsiW
MSNFLGEFPNCTEIKPMLSAYFDGELSVEDMILVEKHLVDCLECSEELERIEALSLQIRSSLRNWAQNSPDNEFERLLPEEIQKCLKITSDISAFIDGELDHAATRAMLEHVIACKYCRKQYDKIKKTSELTKKCLKLSVMDDIQTQNLHTKVINRLGGKKNNVKMLFSAAAVVFIAVLSWFSIAHFTPTTSKDAHIDNTKYVREEKPMYVQSEEYVLSDLNLEPPQGINIDLPKTAYTFYPSYTLSPSSMLIPTTANKG